MTHFDCAKPKVEQRYCKHRPEGVTLGDLLDTGGELFGKHPESKFVMAECEGFAEGEESRMESSEDGPGSTTKTYGISTEKAHRRQREL